MHKLTDITAIYEGYGLKHYNKRSYIGGNDIIQYLKSLLPSIKDENILYNIKETHSFSWKMNKLMENVYGYKHKYLYQLPDGTKFRYK